MEQSTISTPVVDVYVTDVYAQPLQFAHIANLDTNGNIIPNSGGVTDANGVASVQGGPVKITHVGYQPLIVEVGPNGGEFTLQQSDELLSEVVITPESSTRWGVLGIALAALAFFIYLIYDN